MTNQFFASTATPANTEKPAEKVAPVGDQPIASPEKAPASPTPAVKS